MPATLVDAFGRPVEYLGGGRNTLFARTADDERLRPKQANHFDDYMALMGSWSWRSLVSESRAIGSRGLVAAAMLQKADYVSASDWRPYFGGSDSEYGDTVEQVLEDTNHMVCTRGARYDWSTMWRIGSMALGPDGGFFLLLTSSQEGWPLYQPIEAHRIGQRDPFAKVVDANSASTTIRADTGETIQVSTPYVGLRIVDGIIYNRAGAEVAYRVLGATPDDDEDISARDMIHVAPPRWFSEGRPAPQIAPGLLSLLAVDLARAAQLDQQIVDSKLTLIETNETGRRDPVQNIIDPQSAQTSASGTSYDVIERGGVKFIKTGSKLEALSTSRPSSQWMEFDERSAATAIAAIGWRLEMLDPTALRGAATRAFQDQINTQILGTFKAMRHAVKRATQYRVAKLAQIRAIGDHPEFMKWGVTPPPEFVVDRNSAIVDIAMVRAGADSMPNMHRRAGMRPDEVLNQQASWYYKRWRAAKKWSKDGLNIKPDELGNLGQRGDISTADEISNAVKSGAIAPTSDLDTLTRKELGLPPATTPPREPTETPPDGAPDNNSNQNQP